MESPMSYIGGSIFMTDMIMRLIDTIPDFKPDEIAYIFGVTVEEAQQCLDEADKQYQSTADS